MKEYVIIHGELYHYGVPGMKWGHRKKYVTDTDNDKKARLETKKQPTQEEAKAKAVKGKKIALGVLAGIGAVGIGAAAAYGISKAKKGGKPKVSGFDADDVLDGMSVLPKKDRGRMSTMVAPSKKEIIDDALTTLGGVGFWLDVFN